jgi:hypothetical protein
MIRDTYPAPANAIYTLPIQGGDIIRRPKKNGGGWHYGTVLETGMIAHTLPVIGKHICTLEEFCDGLPYSIQRPPRTWQQNLDVQLRALEDIGAPYVLPTANCEHDISRVHTGVSRSPSVDKGILITAAVAAIFLFGSDN